MAQSAELLRQHTRRVVELLAQLGWIINWKKSDTTPSQVKTYLGVSIDSTRMSSSLPEDRLRKMESSVQEMLEANRIGKLTIRAAAKTLGQMSAAAVGISLARLKERPLLDAVRGALAAGLQWDDRLRLDSATTQACGWWLDQFRQWNGVGLIPGTPSIWLTTDASATAQGCTLRGEGLELRSQFVIPAAHVWLSTSRNPTSRKVSRIRAIVLCRFVTLARSKDLEGWLADTLEIRDDKIIVRTECTKGTAASRSYIIPRYTDDASRCPYTAFIDYWSLMRTLGSSPYVWRAITRPFERVKADSIGRITREALEAAGISSDALKPHKLRMVATSQALALGAPADEVQTAGGWRSAQTMYDFYVRRPEAGANVARVLFRLFDLDEQDGEVDPEDS